MANRKPQPHPENLRPAWSKGHSGNPGGRPKRKPITDALIAILDEAAEEEGRKGTRAELVARQLINEAMRGKASTYAAKEVMDRVEGKVPVPLMGVNDAPIDITIISKMPRPKRGKRVDH